MSIRIGNTIVAGMPEKAMRGVGDIFTTTNKGVIAGAVEANGGQYNLADYNSGTDSVASKLAAGALPYVSKTEFQTQVANTGACDSFGWNGVSLYAWNDGGSLTFYTQSATPSVGDTLYKKDGTSYPTSVTVSSYDAETDAITVTNMASTHKFYRQTSSDISDTTFLVPKLADMEFAPDYGTPTKISSLPYTAPQDGWIVLSFTRKDNNSYAGAMAINGQDMMYTHPVQNYSFSDTMYSGPVKAGDVITIHDNIALDGGSPGFYPRLATTSPKRHMVQLATGATDQALETCTGVLSDVAALKEHRVIEFQTPTAANNYTWYRRYADGWVEQGGCYEASAGAQDITTRVTLPVLMADNLYTAVATAGRNTDDAANRAGYTTIFTQTTTTLGIGWYGVNSANTMRRISWQVSGMAA